MTDDKFTAIAGGSPSRPYPARWLSKVIMDRLDAGAVLSIVDSAILEHERDMAMAKAEYGLSISADRKVSGRRDGDGPLADRLYAAFDEVKLLREVRARLVAEIAGTEG